MIHWPVLPVACRCISCEILLHFLIMFTRYDQYDVPTLFIHNCTDLSLLDFNFIKCFADNVIIKFYFL